MAEAEVAGEVVEEGLGMNVARCLKGDTEDDALRVPADGVREEQVVEEAAAEVKGRAVDALEAAQGGVEVQLEEDDGSDEDLPFQDVEQAGSRYPMHDPSESDRYQAQDWTNRTALQTVQVPMGTLDKDDCAKLFIDIIDTLDH